MEVIASELLFKYFFVVGAGLGLGVSITVFPARMLAKKIENGGLRVWRRRR